MVDQEVYDAIVAEITPQIRLAALREVREMVLIRTGWIVEAIDDLIKREEGR